MASHIAESLDGNLGSLEAFLSRLEEFLGDDGDTSSRGFLTTFGSSQYLRFSSHDARFGVPLELRESIHDPGHSLRSRVHVGSRDVDMRAEDGHNLGRVSSC